MRRPASSVTANLTASRSLRNHLTDSSLRSLRPPVQESVSVSFCKKVSQLEAAATIAADRRPLLKRPRRRICTSSDTCPSHSLATRSFTDRLGQFSTIVRSFAFLQAYGEILFLTRLTNCRHRFDAKSRRNIECCFCSVVVEPLHTMHDEVLQGRLQCEILPGSASIK